MVKGQKFGTSPIEKSWDGKYMIPTQYQLVAIPSPDQPPYRFSWHILLFIPKIRKIKYTKNALQLVQI